jgi:hypothetical protein
MDAFFADDSRQRHPSRPEMGPLVATGGIHVPEESIKALEVRLDQLCHQVGFPAGEPFKWSPGRNLWMHNELVDAEREEFFTRALALAQENGVQACVVVEDTTPGSPRRSRRAGAGRSAPRPPAPPPRPASPRAAVA